jgi:hypothetical protein
MRVPTSLAFVSGCTTSALFAGYVGASFLHTRAFHNPRIAYGVHHLPLALLSSAVFALAAAVGAICLSKVKNIEARPTWYFLAGLAALFAVYWLPVLVTAGFVQDDWLLLGPAAIRSDILHHPLHSWYALDSIDGNFRPLGTVLYIGFALKHFGLHAPAFLTANFLFSLGSVLLAFSIARELGYSRVAGALAGLLFLSRGILYTQVAWVCALGDAMVVLMSAVTVLLVLKAYRVGGAKALLYHALALGTFLVSTLAKQSSFTTPLLVILVAVIRPGSKQRPSLPVRLGQAFALAAAYLAIALPVFLHARALLGGRTPYPIQPNFDSISRLFAPATWFFTTLQFPDYYPQLQLLPGILGMLICGVVALAVRTKLRTAPSLQRTISFAIAAAFASYSIFILLPTRGAAYYGTTAAFWFSIALAVALSRIQPASEPARTHAAVALVYLLIVVGFADIRVKQTALIPTGGYIWGTYNMDTERSLYEQIHTLLKPAPQHSTAIFIDAPEFTGFCASMAIVADPTLHRILFYDSRQKALVANDLNGNLPPDDVRSLRDVSAYHWDQPVQDPGDLSSAHWYRFAGGSYRAVEPVDLQAGR